MIFLVIVLAALIHASFHLSISVLTLISGHTLSRERSHLKLVKLSFALILGAVISTILLFSTFAYVSGLFYDIISLKISWAILIGLSIATGISVWLFYYKRNTNNTSGTELWIPRGMAKYLNQRAKRTKHSAEAFSLGVVSVISEVLFFLAPLTISASLTFKLSPAFQFIGLVAYITLANLPIFTIGCMISSGHSISSIQIWREKNKRFLQFIAGLGLIVLGFVVGAVIFTPELFEVLR